MRIFSVVVLALLAVKSSPAVEPVDLTKIDRQIAKEPAYTAEQPLYGMAIIGSSGSLRIWMVLDKTSSESDRYDVVYVDLNGNGDLTEPSEKLDSVNDDRFQLPDVTDPKTDETHTNFELSNRTGEPTTQMLSLRWNGKHKLGGGYPADPEKGYMQFAKSADEAPIVWFNGDGPFHFQYWYSNQLHIGAEDDLKLFLGLPGIGSSSFCAFQEHILGQEEQLVATLIYTNADGNERQAESELTQRC
jgi:hypothetical protein